MPLFDRLIFDPAIFDTGPFVRVLFTDETYGEDRTTLRLKPGYRKAGQLDARYR